MTAKFEDYAEAMAETDQKYFKKFIRGLWIFETRQNSQRVRI